MELAVAETINNAIEHACQKLPGYPISVHLSVYDDRIVMVIADSGQPWRLHDQCAGIAAKRMAEGQSEAGSRELAERGRGLAIIEAVMDEVSYQRSGDSNEVTLVKYLHGGLVHE